MATGISVTVAQTNLDIANEAYKAVMSGQSYQIGTRSLTRANLKDVLEAINYWSEKLAEAKAEENGSSGRNRVYYAVPIDL